MNDYVVYYWGMAGVIQRADPRWETVAFLHCGKDEAEQIARDLGAPFRESFIAVEGSDCPEDCEHAPTFKHM